MTGQGACEPTTATPVVAAGWWHVSAGIDVRHRTRPRVDPLPG